MSEQEKSIGALWLNKEKGFMSGSITIDDTEHKIIVFKNKYKQDGDNQPSYKIFLSRPKGVQADKEPF